MPCLRGLHVGFLSMETVAKLFTTLAADEPDAAQQARPRRIHEVTTEANCQQQFLGIDMLQDWVQCTPPAAYRWIMRHHSRLNVADHHPPPINVVVSNGPGPRAPLLAQDWRLDELYSVGPVPEGVGVNTTVGRNLDCLFVAVRAGARPAWRPGARRGDAGRPGRAGRGVSRHLSPMVGAHRFVH